MKTNGRFSRQLRRRQTRRAVAAAALAAGALAATGGQAQAAFPGTNGLIAFDSNRADFPPTDIYTVDPSAPPTATAVAQSVLQPDSAPTWAPDGKAIAYVSTRANVAAGPQVWVQLDYTDPTAFPATTPATNPGIIRGTVAWSPDMQHIAFTKLLAGSLDVYVVDVNTHAEYLVASGLTSQEQNPTWSPDGRYIAFDSNRGGTFDIWRVPADGSDPTGGVNLTPGTPSDEQHPDYSPGGSAIVFDSDRDQAERDIYVKFANTSTGTYRLTTNASADLFPSFSPDGRKFTWQSDRSDAPFFDVWTQNLIQDTSTYANPQNQTQNNTAADQRPDWQPVGGMCPTPPSGGGSNLPPLPVDPNYPLSATDVANGVGNTGGAADNDTSAGSSDQGSGGTTGSSAGGGGNPCPTGGAGGSSDGNHPVGSSEH